MAAATFLTLAVCIVSPFASALVVQVAERRATYAVGRTTYGNQRRELGFPRPAPGPFWYIPPEKGPGARGAIRDNTTMQIHLPTARRTDPQKG